eukprot:2026232-Rhodomonas_salina.2
MSAACSRRDLTLSTWPSEQPLLRSESLTLTRRAVRVRILGVSLAWAASSSCTTRLLACRIISVWMCTASPDPIALSNCSLSPPLDYESSLDANNLSSSFSSLLDFCLTSPLTTLVPLRLPALEVPCSTLARSKAESEFCFSRSASSKNSTGTCPSPCSAPNLSFLRPAHAHSRKEEVVSVVWGGGGAGGSWSEGGGGRWRHHGPRAP